MIFKDLAIFHGFLLPVRKVFGILEPCKQILKMLTQGTYLVKPLPLRIHYQA
jgi:hypothetical protein